MIPKLALALAALISARSAAPAQEIPTVRTEAGPATCADFRKNSDGAWTPVKDITIVTPDGCTERLGAGKFSFQPALVLFCNVDVGFMLDQHCERR